MPYDVHPEEAAFLAKLGSFAHSPRKCEGQACVIHNPVDGPWRALRPTYRGDRNIVERKCEHGIGHPDPSQWGHWLRSGEEWQTVHGCDGCCEGWFWSAGDFRSELDVTPAVKILEA